MAEVSRVLVVAHVTTVSTSIRDELLNRLEKMSETALKSEPGTLKYAICIPREDDGKSVWVIEEYVDKAGYDTHMATEGVKAAHAWFEEGNVLDPDIQPEVHTLEYIPPLRFDREEVLNHEDPHLIFATLDYIPGGVETSIPYWKAVVETGRNEETGTLVYGILKDPNTVNRLCTIEAYESADYLKDVHVPSKAIQDSIANTKHLRTGLKHNFLKKKSGFLYKK